ncbi:MAG: S41 family peptidase, partial [Anaerolineaceae bacterium]
DSAAQKAGVQDGDRLIAVDDLRIQPDLSIEIIQAAIRGEVGSKVRITIVRPPDENEMVLDVIREEVALPSTTWNITSQNEKVGIIQINIIAETTPEEVKTAVEDLLQRGAQYFILDLRNNNGGLLNAGIDTAGLFLKAGVVIEQQYSGKPVVQLSNGKDGPYTVLPLAVLINQYSASAAEIIAGALQGQQRAVVLGTHSYGKDTIQLVFDLQDGSSLHVTTAQWWVPGLDYSIHQQGIQPDIEVTGQDEDPQLAVDAAIQQLIQ